MSARTAARRGTSPRRPTRSAARPAPAPPTARGPARRDGAQRGASRRRGPGWVPNQHGAWAMLLAPVTVGALAGGPRWVHLLLLAAWVVGYLAYNAAGLWLKARRRARWWPPVRAYGALAVALVVALLVVEPGLAVWGVVLAPALGTSLLLHDRRADRSMLNDLVAVVAAGAMTLVAYGLGTAADAGGPLPGASSARAWVLAAALTAYFVGTVPYVKTMIRERGNRAMLRGSVIYHAVLLLVAAGGWFLVRDAGQGAPLSATGGAALTALAAVALARAAVVPRAWPRATPAALGIGEIALTVALVAALLLG